MVSDSVCRHQWVQAVGKFSSELSNTNNSTKKMIGMPNIYPKHGADVNAWQPKTGAGTEYVELCYRIPVYITKINIYETLNPGSVVKVEAYNPDRCTWKTVWSTSGPNTYNVSRIFSPELKGRPFRTHCIKLTLECNNVLRQIDAVEIQGYNYYNEHLFEPSVRKLTERFQWVKEVLSFSSQYDAGNYSANQLIGSPKVYPTYGSKPGSWTPVTRDANQFVEIKYEVPVYPVKLRIYELMNGGAVVKIEGWNSKKEEFESIWMGNMANYKYTRKFDALLKLSNKMKYDRFKVWFDCTAYPSEWVAVDCIELIGTNEIEDEPPQA